LASRLLPQIGDQSGAEQLGPIVAPKIQAHHLSPGQRVDRGPGGRINAQDGEFERQAAPVAFDVSVYTVGIGLHDEASLIFHQRPVLLGRLPQADGAQKTVGIQGAWAQDCAQGPAGDPAVELHLPEPILGVDIALGEKEIMLVLRKDMGHSPLVPDHLYWCREPGDGDGALDLGPRPPHKPGATYDQDENYKCQHDADDDKGLFFHSLLRG